MLMKLVQKKSLTVELENTLLLTGRNHLDDLRAAALGAHFECMQPTLLCPTRSGFGELRTAAALQDHAAGFSLLLCQALKSRGGNLAEIQTSSNV